LKKLYVKIDFHVHSRCSHDSLITSDELVFHAKRNGLDAVAVTDHDRFDGALRIADETDFLVIPGMEISSSDGHVLGLNVGETVPKNMSVDETVDKIHQAGGIAVACHPTGFFKGSLGGKVSGRFDAIEVINAASFPFSHCTRRNEELASRFHLPRVAGSDAHYGPEIGCAYTLVESELDAEQIIEAVRRGRCKPFGRPIPLTTRLKGRFLTMLAR
jgi:predicted metal-dependent phosphoesterase TrpH